LLSSPGLVVAASSRIADAMVSKKASRELSVIVPTYNEVDNSRPLTERLFKATKDAGLTIEMLVVDDESKGSDETARIVGELAKEGHAVRIHSRKRREGRGLSSAVI
jgi:dolichol-phosphate mannosyltransferase